MELHWYRAKAIKRLRWPSVVDPKRHSLGAPLIVSLTTYPARFDTVHLTLGCLLDQTVQPDRIILWIASEHLALVPDRVTALGERGIEIRACTNLGPFKKLICALEAFPSAYIVTADDDLYYAADWLEHLVRGSDGKTIVCHRAHRPTRDTNGVLKPYLQWEIDTQDERARLPSSDIMPTSGAGVLYPPGSLDEMVTDRARFEALCPTGDDLWYFWMARRAGALHMKVGPQMILRTWPRSQVSALWDENSTGGNDRMIAALEAELGPLD